ncbi:uncharacterized protein FIBRA_03435 [Fibroporia radiculosa]|uniref:Uncharacterized protein n=1 Tax=Fibroporia radiculosa TaxID=599839 RepID=J4H2E5_9APHY|nr:uncharacterized protein FIBRA_03435 [Fibroporia radiculosa]CCM01384.1 predicted protein [Fibroporia radiculosa]
MTHETEEAKREVEDGLFFERLQTLFDKHLADLRAFAERETRPFDEVRRRFAEWHCDCLFAPSPAQGDDAQERINTILRYTSQTLESLREIAGLQSFFLVVNPRNVADEGFLGGTLFGREFWRGHRGCGVSGAKAFQAQCMKSEKNEIRSSTAGTALEMSPSMINISSQKRGPASSLKAEVYASVRDAIRAASGIRNAEMKWKDHSKLDVYGIRLEGWPPAVPMRNPSALSATQNKQILEALNAKTMTFIRTRDASPTPAGSTSISMQQESSDGADVIEDWIDYSPWASKDQDDSLSEEQSVGTSDVTAASCGASYSQQAADLPSIILDLPDTAHESYNTISPSPLKKRRRDSG